MSPSVTTSLRVAVFVATAAAVVDPGCPWPVRPRLELTIAGEVPEATRATLRRRVQSTAPWADVVVPTAGTRVDAHLVAGDAAPVLAHVRTHSAALAIRLDPPLEVTAVAAPIRVAAGTRVPIRVQVDGPPGQLPPIRLTVVDADSGMTEAVFERGERAHGAVTVPWLAVREGPRRLRLRAEPVGDTTVRPSPWVDLALTVTPAGFRTHLLEARPTWVGRFTRLALASGGDTGLSLDVRAAPGVLVRRGEDADLEGAEGQADVIVVSGVEALTEGDVSRLERRVRDGGRGLVLLLDEPPGPGSWRRLWAGGLGRVTSASTPQAIDLAGAQWRTREWLAGVTSTGAVPLAYVDKGPPAVLARSLGAGRVVLVTALDAWRWRAEPGVTWAEGWQSLLRRLAADVPPPVEVTAWVSGTGADRVLQVDARLRGDVAAGEMAAVEARVEDQEARPLTLVSVQPRRWRGGTRVGGDGTARVTVTIPTAAGVVAQGAAVVHVGPVIPPAAWHAVARHQQDRGELATDDAGLASSLAALRPRLIGDDGRRWFVTRTWWYAALVLAGLGSEWVIRRARRLA